MSQGFVNPLSLSLPLSIANGGTGASTASSARDNLVLNNSAFPNIIIGGNFTTNPWQRGTTFTSIGSGAYSADRFWYAYNGGGVNDALKTADSPTVAEAGVYSTSCLHFDVTTADASIASGEFYCTVYKVEGYDIAAAGFGQSGTRYVTLSFWHKHTITGTYSVSFRNGANDRSYIAEYTQAVADTWEKATITIAVDTSGTWLYTNGNGLDICFAIACGSTYATSPNSWTAGNYLASTNQVNGMSSTSNNFKLALIKLELGSIATPYPVENEQQVLARCQRYFSKTFSQGVTPSNSSADSNGTQMMTMQVANQNGSSGIVWNYPVTMRGNPTITLYNYRTAGTDGQWDSGSSSLANASTASVGTQGALLYDAGATASVARWYIHATADAEI